MEFRPIDRRSIVQDVADQLREAVVTAVTHASQLPSEAELSNALMVSRPTLREALRVLETEGLVQRDHRTAPLRPDAGTASMSRPLRSALDILTRTERTTMAEIVDLRLAVEGSAAERTAEIATAEDLAKLASALDAMGEPRLTDQEWDERSLAFHVAMVSASHNEAFLLVMVAAREAAADILERAIRSAAPSDQHAAPSTSGPRVLAPEWLDGQYQLYRQIYDAIRDGRGGDARARLLEWAETIGIYFAPVPDDPYKRRAPTGSSRTRKSSGPRPRSSSSARAGKKRSGEQPVD